ncbi:MAG: ribosome small subunit-dependent GTPase A [Clostridiales bacterium]|nr:ribosome small subunit-dependent GTPase A [Clostridiales bacterium]MDY4171195.1 ribosome small subunit-dependent GTPase A [Evtepia sp.]
MSERKEEGIIRKALSGFYYVQCGGELITCRARGKFRYQKQSPLVGDRVTITVQGDGSGSLDEIQPRRNAFRRPAVANLDQLVIIASGAIPVSDPYLLDRIISLAESKGCEPILCINKWDLVPAQELLEIYRSAGITTLPVSAVTGLGIEELRALLAGKTSAFTGNSGVGKSSILNALDPAFGLATGEISEKLGRGRHTTRHVELFPVAGGLIADTPGFSAFDNEKGGEPLEKEALAETFREFRPYLDQCRFIGCAHVKEAGCAVLEALEAGKLSPSRHRSYVRLYELAKETKPWEKP